MYPISFWFKLKTDELMFRGGTGGGWKRESKAFLGSVCCIGATLKRDELFIPDATLTVRKRCWNQGSRVG